MDHPAMTLSANVSLRLGDLDLRVDLVAPAGEVTAVLGPNGAGKTTLLRAVAGAVAVDAGEITLGGVVLDRPPDRFVPREQRR
ncbi:MAG: ATP-binding cassette domain-containing protein, partial [Acidimicrobiales bacterium]|nr:ATP-binding cassette domain-containing protein [Acidimicrobiales bacterium]